MLHDDIIVDCFAGGGGASVGIEKALGRDVDIAVNLLAIPENIQTSIFDYMEA